MVTVEKWCMVRYAVLISMLINWLWNFQVKLFIGSYLGSDFFLINFSTTH